MSILKVFFNTLWRTDVHSQPIICPTVFSQKSWNRKFLVKNWRKSKLGPSIDDESACRRKIFCGCKTHFKEELLLNNPYFPTAMEFINQLPTCSETTAWKYLTFRGMGLYCGLFKFNRSATTLTYSRLKCTQWDWGSTMSTCYKSRQIHFRWKRVQSLNIS